MQELSNNRLISIIGPTGIGKTALSIALAKYFNTEIISADSRQFFKEMCIGTAVPSLAELAAAPHHFIQNKSVHQLYTVGDFEQEALALLTQLFTKHQTVIMVGGSGMYVNAVLKGLDHFPDVSPTLRNALKERLVTNGLVALQNELAELDPVSYKRIDLGNPQRVLRALEVSIGTGSPFSSFLNKDKKARNFRSVKIGLTADRKIIYERINKRVDLMMEDGLLEEARALFPLRELNALQTVGYRELFRHFSGEISLATAVEEIKKNTRRFAKRQLTWYRKDEEVIWFSYDTPIGEIVQELALTFMD